MLCGATLRFAQGGPYARQKVDTAAATRGPNLIRSVVLRDRLGNGIGPAVRKKSDAHQADLADAQMVATRKPVRAKGTVAFAPADR
jgi:hypothetical protein